MEHQIELKPVESSKLIAVGYDAEHSVLRASFKPSGALYDYFAVPADVYEAFLAAQSKGVFFGERITGPRPSRQNPTPKVPFPWAKVEGPLWSQLWEGAVQAALQPSLSLEEIREVSHAATKRLVGDEVAESAAQAGPEPAEVPETREGIVALAKSAQANAKDVVAKVDTPAQYEFVVALIVAKKAEKKTALAKVATMKDPAYRAYKAILEFEKEVTDNYDSAIGLLDRAATQWRQRQQDEQRKAQREIQEREQKRLDAIAAEERERQQAAQEREADRLAATGLEQLAEQVRAEPVHVPVEQAQAVVVASTVPKVEGSRVTVNWKCEIEKPELVAHFYKPQIMDALIAAGITAPTPQQMMVFVARLSKTFDEFHTVDEKKIGARVRTLKQGAVGLIPGVRVWSEEKTGSTGR